MHDKPTNDAKLILEETLYILQECLQNRKSTFPATSIESHHIKKLKAFYSPQFDFDHSDSGSYFFAALQSIKAQFIDNPADQEISLSINFKQSLECLLDISMLSMNYRKNQNAVIEQLLSLAGRWDLHHSMDIQSLMISILEKMRAELLNY